MVEVLFWVLWLQMVLQSVSALYHISPSSALSPWIVLGVWSWVSVCNPHYLMHGFCWSGLTSLFLLYPGVVFLVLCQHRCFFDHHTVCGQLCCELSDAVHLVITWAKQYIACWLEIYLGFQIMVCAHSYDCNVGTTFQHKLCCLFINRDCGCPWSFVTIIYSINVHDLLNEEFFLYFLYCTWWSFAGLCQCPFFEHLLRLESHAGHVCLECGMPRHLAHLWFDVSLLCSSLLGFRLLSLLFLEMSNLPLAILSTLAASNFSVPCRILCCFFANSLCLAKLIAFSSVRFGSGWTFSDRRFFRSPTTMRSLMSSSFSAPNWQCSVRTYSSVIKSPVEYTNVLTWLSRVLWSLQVSLRNLQIHFSQSSGLNENFLGDGIW